MDTQIYSDWKELPFQNYHVSINVEFPRCNGLMIMVLLRQNILNRSQ